MKRLFLTLSFVLLLVATSFAAQADTIKVLAIGNSFSEDAVEEHLSELARAENLIVVIGNMYIGGCSLERHVNNLRGDLAEYRYRKIDPQGDMTEIKGYTLAKALNEENWDYISVQQASPLSGKPESFTPWLAELVAFIRNKVPAAEIMFHQTWAYSPDSSHNAFINYNKDQLQMYHAIITTVEQEANKVGIDLVIPSGTAIQNARTSFLGNDLTRDGYHLSRPIGRYIAACTWLEAVLGVNPMKNTYCPDGMNYKECKVAQKAAHKAVRKPMTVSNIK